MHARRSVVMLTPPMDVSAAASSGDGSAFLGGRGPTYPHFLCAEEVCPHSVYRPRNIKWSPLHKTKVPQNTIDRVMKTAREDADPSQRMGPVGPKNPRATHKPLRRRGPTHAIKNEKV